MAPQAAADADRHGALIQGLYSNTARQTEFEISNLRAHCEFHDEPIFDETPRVRRKRKTTRHEQESSCNRLTKTVGQHRVEMAMRAKAQSVKAHSQADAKGPSGDLARAIQEKLGQKMAAAKRTAMQREASPESPKSRGRQNPPRSETSSFTSLGIYDGPWTSKFTASRSPGALNRWKSDQRPDPAWYKVQYNMLLDRAPVPDMQKRGRSSSPESGEPLALCDGSASPKRSQGTFNLTGIDVEKIESEWRFSDDEAKRRAMQLAEGYLAKTPNWDQYNSMKVGRFPALTFHRVTEPAKDLYEQDLKAYHKQRIPAWDFAKAAGRPGQETDDVAAPGKYDVNYSAVRGKIPSGVHFERALPRAQSDGRLGHFALQAVLHADAKRFPGGVRFDTSASKDCIRRRMTLVNDFDRELPRPNPAPRSLEYHDTSDPAACEITLSRMMSYNADLADMCVTNRRDMAPVYERMLPRGKESVQGLRALQTDLGVRGAAGLGFIETTGQRTLPVEKLEGRTSNAAYQRPDIGPKFDHHTYFEALCLETNHNQGNIVIGSGPSFDTRPAPRCPRRVRGEMHFRRQAAQGFSKGVKAAGPSDAKVPRQSRAYKAIDDWSQLLEELNSKSAEPELLH
ncbi:unnamed protein product [Symbiodinium pilosum]|uniref:Uncharacterized protein n=1 Tax=Symbiodinium pilosum TaxID=2952 RepID=A0A812VVI1_SYMPI|nr:unnamed protein product [Symbiodinium pilosum]